MNRRTFVVGLLVLALMATASVVGPRAFVVTQAAAPAPMTFNPNLLLQGSSGAAEPSIRTDSHGQSFVIGPTGVPAGCKAFRVSHDGSTSAYLGFPDHTAGGGDCDWAIGPQETSSLPTFGAPSDDGLAYSSLTLPNITVGKSNDGGKTFGPPNVASTQLVGDDRMWMAADPKLNAAGFNTIFMSYHDVSIGDIEVSISIDGGQTYRQSNPLIDPTNTNLVGVWENNNELGNIVSRRDPSTGALNLYSIFETPDSAPDNASQSAAMTNNYNRVWEAVGKVTDPASTGALPVISWSNYEVYHGPVGSRFNRIFPVTAVDSAGGVYAIWTDGNHVFVKSDATGTGWNAATAPVTITNPIPSGGTTAVNTTVMPWAAAGASGIVDVVFYGATGGSGAQPKPQDDGHNVWNVYLAQSTDGGATFTVSQASDHPIHTGQICIDGTNCGSIVASVGRTLADFFQVSIDPTNGAADIAYADDHASPGNSALYFTRQCTGISATTGATLANDCKVPPPPTTLPQGSTCPGPQVVDFTGDAPNNYPAGDGSNMDNLDIVNAFFSTPNDGNSLTVTLTINNLQAPPPPTNMLSAFWTVYWTYNGTVYYAQATSNGTTVGGTGQTAVFTYSDGTYSGGTFTSKDDSVTGSVSGTATLGKNGTFVITVPRKDVGLQNGNSSTQTLTQPYADTHGSFTVAGNGEYFTAAADRAPDANYGANYVVGQTCQSTNPPPCPDVDANGDMHGKKDGDAKAKVDDDKCQASDDDGDSSNPSNSAQYQDPGTGTNFQSTQILTTQINLGTNTAVLTGTGTDNGNPVTFTITMVNGGSSATDTFSILLSDGYSNAGSLLDGAISV